MGKKNRPNIWYKIDEDIDNGRLFEMAMNSAKEHNINVKEYRYLPLDGGYGQPLISKITLKDENSDCFDFETRW